MIDLDERDVKAVARARFIRTHEKPLAIALIGAIAVFLGLAYLAVKVENFSEYIAIIPIITLFVYIAWYIKTIYKKEKELVEEWRKNK